ncbi:uncharacterized protein LOC131693572 [Topomyia yanbarensis]|uniref:uncharacterized protein LOC131693572 n=1 Tax=Topomyia yanbarensis TaxID=2498891 RepID=UPI00273B3F8A|nr:uncharacterized protein LOC131693572 [Topomyia yanbarensis]
MLAKLTVLVCLAVTAASGETKTILLTPISPISYTTGYHPNAAVATATPLAYSYPSGAVAYHTYSSPHLVAGHTTLTAAPVAYAAPTTYTVATQGSVKTLDGTGATVPAIRSTLAVPTLF